MSETQMLLFARNAGQCMRSDHSLQPWQQVSQSGAEGLIGRGVLMAHRDRKKPGTPRQRGARLLRPLQNGPR